MGGFLHLLDGPSPPERPPIEGRLAALGGWADDPERIAEWAGFAPTRPGTWAVLLLVRNRVKALGHVLAGADVLDPGAIASLGRAAVTPSMIDDGDLEDVYADAFGLPVFDRDRARAAVVRALTDGATTGLCVAAALMAVPITAPPPGRQLPRRLRRLRRSRPAASHGPGAPTPPPATAG